MMHILSKKHNFLVYFEKIRIKNYVKHFLKMKNKIGYMDCKNQQFV